MTSLFCCDFRLGSSCEVKVVYKLLALFEKFNLIVVSSFLVDSGLSVIHISNDIIVWYSVYSYDLCSLDSINKLNYFCI